MDSDAETVKLYDINSPKRQKIHGFGLFTIKRLGQILKIVFSKKICIIFLLLICLIALLEQYLAYNIGILPSGFYKILGDQNVKAFWLQLLKSLLIILAMCVVLSCKKYITNVFYVSAREIITDKLHLLYFTSNKFYYLNNLKYTSTDNPDQRITQDVDKFCSQFSSVINPLVIAPFTISYYSYDCYQTTGWFGPVSIFIIFILSASFNKLLMKPIMTMVMRQEKCEGNFRFKHMHVRTNAESIAFQNASCAELSRVDSKLFDLIKIQQSLYLREFPLNIAVNIFNYTGGIISYLLLAYPIFNGTYSHLTASELGALISKNAFVSIFLISCFSSIINVSSSMSEIGGFTHRICDMLDALNMELSPDVRKSTECINFKLKLHLPEASGEYYDPAIELQNVTFCAPNENKPLICDINLTINVGMNLLITGKSSSGKTSLFRIIRGLWSAQSGHIVRRLPFEPSCIFFLPQRPLLSDGTLIEQIVYPLEISHSKPTEVDMDLILSYLKFVKLQHLIAKAGLDSEVEWNWADVLSPGEAQRLSFVRLFYHKPKLAFLDEATSALELELELELYEKCKELDITVISIGHRESLIQFHDNVLHLDGNGGWILSSTTEIANL